MAPTDELSQVFARSHSALVRELATMTERQRRLLGIGVLQLHVADLAFDAVRLLLAYEERPLVERVVDLEGRFESPEIQSALSCLPAWLEDPKLPKWIDRLSKPNFQAFLVRVLGIRRYRRLEDAFRRDAALALIAARRALHWVLPVVAAADRCMRTLDPSQLSHITDAQVFKETSLIGWAVTADSYLDGLVDRGVIGPLVDARPEERHRLGDADEVEALMGMQVSAESARAIQALGDRFGRKLQGARDALSHSSDGVSQAANSLVELIDRLLRDGYSEKEVIEWCRKNVPDRRNLTYLKDDREAPTKRAQALCFVYASAEVGDSSVLHELAAASIVATRSVLQGLKHADEGSEEEHQALRLHLATLEAALLMVCRCTWVTAPEDRLTALRARLAPAA